MSERRDKGQGRGPRGVARLPEAAGCEHGSFIDEVWLGLVEAEDFVRQASRGRLSDLLRWRADTSRDSSSQAERTHDEAIAHLRNCGPCRARLRQLKTWQELSVRVGEIAASYDAPAIPPELEAAILRGARDTAQPAPTRRRRWLSRRLAVAGIAAAAVLAAVYGFRRTGPSRTALSDHPEADPADLFALELSEEILRAMNVGGPKPPFIVIRPDDPAARARPTMNEETLPVRDRDSVLRAAYDAERRWRAGALSRRTATLHCGRNDITIGALVDSVGTVAALITQAVQHEMIAEARAPRMITIHVYRKDGAEVGGIRLDQYARVNDVPSPLSQEAARARVERPECPAK